jgi:hypothetical protein
VTPDERADLLAKFEAGRKELLASIEGLCDADAGARPAADRWSAIENIEHLAIVEAHLLRSIQEASPVALEPIPRREAVIFERVKRRTSRVSAPESAQPSGECPTLATALARFDATRKQTVVFVESCDRDLRACSMTHPLLGPMTPIECLFMLAAHPFRHADQIRELRST